MSDTVKLPPEMEELVRAMAEAYSTMPPPKDIMANGLRKLVEAGRKDGWRTGAEAMRAKVNRMAQGDWSEVSLPEPPDG